MPDSIYPSMKQLSERGLVTASLILGCLLFVSMVAKPSVVADPMASGIATAGIILSSFMAGWCYAGSKDRSSVIGFGVGMPLGFLYFQNSYAREAGMVDLALGSSRIMAVAGLIAILSAAAAWAWRRFAK